MIDNHIHELIGKYLANQTSREEGSIVKDWLAESDEHAQEFEWHKKAWQETKIRFKSPEAEFVFKQVLNGIDDQQITNSDGNSITSFSKMKKSLGYLVRIAAVVLLILSVWYVFKNYPPFVNNEVQVINTVQKQNIAGQKSKIFLPDGSEVWLNAESSISYPEQFSSNQREIYLEGEAFFKVIKDHERPFVVKSGNVFTTVLGTSFNVRAFKDESKICIALKTGKVKVEINQESDNKTLFLEPGDGLFYNKLNHQTQIEEFDEEQLLSWRDGIIVFKNADLDEIISTLSRWYGVKFTVKNYHSEKWTYKGSFDNEILDNVLKSIGFSEGFSHTFNDKNKKEVIIEF
jgi:ferric-dicitrate binding protein FerR (iron transport regulator)